MSAPTEAAPREHVWSAPVKAVAIAVITIVMGLLFVASYSLALVGDLAGRCPQWTLYSTSRTAAWCSATTPRCRTRCTRPTSRTSTRPWT